MAITNAQQYKQLLAQGGRTGFRGGGQDAGKDSDFKLSGTTARKQNTRLNQPAKNNTGSYDEAGVNQGPGVTDKDREIIGGGLTTQRSRFVDRRNYPKIKLGVFDILTGGKATKKFVDFSSAINRPYFYDKVIKAGKLDPKKFGISYYNLDEYTDDQLEEAYQKYNRARLSNEIDAYGNPIMGGDGMYSDGAVLPKEGILAADAADAIDPIEDEDQIINYRLLADGGRAAFAGGSDMGTVADSKGNVGSGKGGYQGGGTGPVQDKSSEGQTSMNDAVIMMNKMKNQNLKEITNPNLIEKFPYALRAIDLVNLDKMMAKKNLNTITTDDDENETVVSLGMDGPSQTVVSSGMDGPSSTVYSLDMDGPETISLGSGLAENAKQDIIENKQLGAESLSEAEAELMNQGILPAKAEGGRIGLMEGGMPYEGGIMDLETSRQQYGLGKLVRKITRGVKKIAKSPIGKAALLYFGGKGLMSLGSGAGPGSIFSKLFGANNTMKGFANISTAKMPGILGKLGLTKGYGSMMPTALGGIAASTLGSYFLTPKDDDDDNELYAGADIADPRFIMANNRDFTNTRLLAEGGSTEEKEPVAKKTMPLLDMDGQEMDLRAEGGFVPLGRMEKADDVPARLSKNEFVFTAEAVRNAGEGDVDKGAEVMYNMMKNLESGGEVSEESQGLEGAREMFQTSQRLEEVI